MQNFERSSNIIISFSFQNFCSFACSNLQRGYYSILLLFLLYNGMTYCRSGGCSIAPVLALGRPRGSHGRSALGWVWIRPFHRPPTGLVCICLQHHSIIGSRICLSFNSKLSTKKMSSRKIAYICLLVSSFKILLMP